MTARDAILGRIRDALGDRPIPPPVPRDYHISSHLDPSEVIARFVDRVDDYHATIQRCRLDQLPATIAAALSGAQRIVVPAGLDQSWLDQLAPETEVLRDHGQLDTTTLDQLDAVLTGAAVGIAETGTIILDAHHDQGRRALTLVPDHHVCIVHTDQLVATVPEALTRLDPTRPLTLISGPSATSDIELDRVEGVHGPRTLHVVLVTGS
jgi:L-lactate dehydrogenase complex protein LldG